MSEICTYQDAVDFVCSDALAVVTEQPDSNGVPPEELGGYIMCKIKSARGDGNLICPKYSGGQCDEE
jgi:hypothetical protein